MPRKSGVNFVNGSLFSVSVQTPQNRVVVREFVCDSTVSQTMTLLRKVTTTGDVIPDRVLAQPVAICRQGFLLVAQFVTQHIKYVQFLLVDILAKEYFVFRDTVKHFMRDFAFAESIQCCLSPDHHMMVLRLPRGIMRPHKSSLSLTVCKRNSNQPIAMHNPILGTEKFPVQDRKFYMLTFDPRFPRRLLSMHPNDQCTKCIVQLRDQIAQTTVVQKVISLGKLERSCLPFTPESYFHNSDDYDSEDSEDESLMSPISFQLVSCNMEYCRTGDRIILCCRVVDSLKRVYLRLFIIDADTFSCIREISHQLCETIHATEPFQIRFTTCDSQVYVQQVMKSVGLEPQLAKPMAWSANIPRQLSLLARCRAKVLQCLKPGAELMSLPLPSSLIRYLEFNFRSTCTT